MVCACTRLAARPDLGPLRQESPEGIVVLVIDLLGALATKGADLLTAHKAAFSTATRIASKRPTFFGASATTYFRRWRRFTWFFYVIKVFVQLHTPSLLN